MSFGDLLSDLAASGGIPAPAAAYTRGVLITQGVRAGESANSIISGMSSLGIGVQRQQALGLIRAETERQAAGATSAQLDLNAPVSEILSGTPPVGFTGQYVHEVAVTWRERDVEGNYMLNERTFAVKSGTVLTSGEAQSAVLDIISQGASMNPDRYPIDPDSILSTSLSGAWYDTQGRNLPSVS